MGMTSFFEQLRNHKAHLKRDSKLNRWVASITYHAIPMRAFGNTPKAAYDQLMIEVGKWAINKERSKLSPYKSCPTIMFKVDTPAYSEIIARLKRIKQKDGLTTGKLKVFNH